MGQKMNELNAAPAAQGYSCRFWSRLKYKIHLRDAVVDVTLAISAAIVGRILWKSEDWWHLIISCAISFVIFVSLHLCWKSIALLIARDQKLEALESQPKTVLPDATLKDSDPRIEVEFQDDVNAVPGLGFIQRAIYFTLVNRGGNSANFACLSPIRLRQHWVSFPEHAESLNISRSAIIHPHVTRADGATNKANLFEALFEDYQSFNDPKLHELTKELIATYQDDAKHLFETRCDLVFSPSGYTDRTTLGKAGSVVIQIKNQKHKKIAERI